MIKKLVITLFFALAISTSFAQNILPQLASDSLTPELISKWQEEINSYPLTKNSLSSRTKALITPLNSVNEGNYTLLDSADSLAGWSRDSYGSQNPVSSIAVIPSPFSYPAGGNALFQSCIGESYSPCHIRYLTKNFYFETPQKSGSAVGAFIKVLRKCDSCYYSYAGVMVHVYNQGQYLGSVSAGTCGGWPAPSWPNDIALPNGYSGFVRLPINEGEFDQISFNLLNYACYGDNETVADHIIFFPNEPPSIVLSENIGGGSSQSSGSDDKDSTEQVAPPSPEPQQCPMTDDKLPADLPGNNKNANITDPVNIVSGNFFHFEKDSELKSRLPLRLIRNYNSLDKRLSIFGRGWSSPLTANLQFDDNNVIFTNSDGSRIIFKKDGDNYITPAGHDVKLTHFADASLWSVSIPQGSEWFFNEDGKITRMVKACCGGGAYDAIDFEYDTNKNLVKVVNPSGQYFQFTIADGLVTLVTDSSGRTTSYEYNSNKDLVKFTDPLGRITKYSYDNDGFLTQITKPSSITTSIEYSDNRVVKITNPDASVNSFTWNETEKKLTLTDGTGVNHEYTFDENGYPLGYTVPSKSLSKTLAFSDTAVSGLTDSLGFTTSYQYNSDGYIASITDKLGSVTSYEYEPTLHKLTKKTDSLGRNWSYEWCSRGNRDPRNRPGRKHHPLHLRQSQQPHLKN